MYYPGPLHKISSQSVHNIFSNVVHRQTDKQTNRQTNATKNITSFAKEVIITANEVINRKKIGHWRKATLTVTGLAVIVQLVQFHIDTDV